MSFDHLKILGCLAYWLVNDNIVSNKFDYRGKKMIFIGYTQSTKNYLLLDPTTNNVVKACDIVFNENELGYQAIMMNVINSKSNHIDNDKSQNNNVARLTSNSSDIITYNKEALKSLNSSEWISAMEKEINDLIQ